jgi:hypothetical protein
MKDRIDILDWDKLSMYDQDDLLQLAFVAREVLVELESENRFLHSVVGYVLSRDVTLMKASLEKPSYEEYSPGHHTHCQS